MAWSTINYSSWELFQDIVPKEKIKQITLRNKNPEQLIKEFYSYSITLCHYFMYIVNKRFFSFSTCYQIQYSHSIARGEQIMVVLSRKALRYIPEEWRERSLGVVSWRTIHSRWWKSRCVYLLALWGTMEGAIGFHSVTL